MWHSTGPGPVTQSMLALELVPTEYAVPTACNHGKRRTVCRNIQTCMPAYTKTQTDVYLHMVTNMYMYMYMYRTSYM